MAGGKGSLAVAVILIAVGTCWLLSTLGVMPQINWIWTLGLGLTGGLIFGLIGIDKITIVAGSFFIMTSILSVLRQTGRISFDVEVPILVITSGLLLMISRLPAIPRPKWLLEDSISHPDSPQTND
ncbi:hypothetical protein GC176_09775 [bacterium]|nr:hypothetical protein [bacterium]